MPKIFLALLIVALMVTAGCGAQQTATDTHSGTGDAAAETKAAESGNIKPNVATSFNKEVDTP